MTSFTLIVTYNNTKLNIQVVWNWHKLRSAKHNWRQSHTCSGDATAAQSSSRHVLISRLKEGVICRPLEAWLTHYRNKNSKSVQIWKTYTHAHACICARTQAHSCVCAEGGHIPPSSLDSDKRGDWRRSLKESKGMTRRTPVVDLACADVRELPNPDGSEVTRASLHPIAELTGVSEPGQNQERFWTLLHNMLSWPLSWPGTWGDDAWGRRGVFALPAVCTQPALLGENLIIDHWSTRNKPVSKRCVPAHALIEDCFFFNADWFGGVYFLV